MKNYIQRNGILVPSFAGPKKQRGFFTCGPGLLGKSGGNATNSLLHFDGNFTDQQGRVWTPASGSASISTLQFQFGGASLHSSGSTNSCISTPYTSSLDLLSMPAWTIECFAYQNAATPNLRIFSTGGGTVAFNGTNGIHVLLQVIGSTALNLQVASAATSVTMSGTTMPTATWQHVAASYDGTNYRLFQGGVLQTTSPLTGFSRPTGNPNAYIAAVSPTDGNSWVGYIDEFRISNVCRYTSTFTPPTAEFPYPG